MDAASALGCPPGGMRVGGVFSSSRSVQRRLRQLPHEEAIFRVLVEPVPNGTPHDRRGSHVDARPLDHDYRRHGQ